MKKIYLFISAFLFLTLLTQEAYSAVSVSNGVYNIVTALDSKKALDVWGRG